MCRWLAYSGTPILLEELLYKTRHSLIDQSMHARMGVETTNGDGFGVGWYGVDAATPGLPGRRDTGVPVVFRGVGPAWSDVNLRELARSTAGAPPHAPGPRAWVWSGCASAPPSWWDLRGRPARTAAGR